jgi:predicted GNAT family acetyltransferase
MGIQHNQAGSKGSFYVKENEIVLAEMTYSAKGTTYMIIDHTEVSDALIVKNVGCQLVHTAVVYARTNHIKILPGSPFAKPVFDKKKDEMGDVRRGK